VEVALGCCVVDRPQSAVDPRGVRYTTALLLPGLLEQPD